MSTKEKFVDYYEVLGVWPTADADAIKKAYFKLARMHHPDVVSKTGSDNEPEQAGIDFKLINEAFGILSDEIKRREFDQKLKQNSGGGGAVTERKEADKRSAQLAFEQAKTAMKHNRYDKAVVLLKSAINYDDSNPAYHSWYGFSLGVLKTHLHEARDACKKALEMEFYNSDFHANLGFVYHQAGLTSTANESFEEALKWDPEHHVALKYHSGDNAKTDSENKGLGGIFSNMFKRSKKPEKPKTGKKPTRQAKAANSRKR
jgi:curved DNA-binding protein CbpA